MMRPHRRAASAALLLVMLLVAAACGQKPGVGGQITPLAGGGLLGASPPPEGAVGINEQGQYVDAEGNVLGPAGASSLGTGGSAGTTGGTTGTTGGEGGSGLGGGATGGGASEPSGGNAAGVTADKIVIGVHAPLTGAVPVPSDSVDKGKDLYYRWLHEEKDLTINGREVEVIIKNDQYNPSTAVSVCKEMVEKDDVFMLSGVGGTDQIAACARYAEGAGVPYVAAGVTEQGISGYRSFFGISMTYPEQGPLLADYMLNKLGARSEKNGMLMFDSASFNDAHDIFKSAFTSKGGKIDYDRRVSKGAGAPDANTRVQEMNLAGIENVYVLTSPVYFAALLKAANAQGYHPQWVGVGISMTFDTVVVTACGDGPAIDGAKFFSPFPAFIDSNKFDPDFQAAVRKFYPQKCGTSGCGDDFMFLPWWLTKVFAQTLELPGKALTRERFVYLTERARGLQNKIGPTLNFSPTDHFGASQVHVNEARCSDRRWHTIQSFASDF
ncbi:MAG: ABC transporter substrate-binding protein [Actinomycetota bacterium]